MSRSSSVVCVCVCPCPKPGAGGGFGGQGKERKEGGSAEGGAGRQPGPCCQCFPALSRSPASLTLFFTAFKHYPSFSRRGAEVCDLPGYSLVRVRAQTCVQAIPSSSLPCRVMLGCMDSIQLCLPAHPGRVILVPSLPCTAALSWAWPSAHLAVQRSSAVGAHEHSSVPPCRTFKGKEGVLWPLTEHKKELCQAAPPSSCPVTSTQ